MRRLLENCGEVAWALVALGALTLAAYGVSGAVALARGPR